MSLLRPACLFSLGLLVAVAVCPGATSPSAPDRNAAETKPSVVPKGSPELSLKRGMPADAVKQAMGKPDHIKPMREPNGTAEVWVYSRRNHGTTERVMIGSKPIEATVKGTDGVVRVEQIGSEEHYRTIHPVTIETVELLRFNQHFLGKKITRVERQEFE